MLKPIFIEINAKVGVKETLIFSYDEDTSVVTKVEVPCICSAAKFNNKEKQVIIEYTPQDIPKHLLQDGKDSYSTTKSIKVWYTDKDDSQHEQTLLFTANVTR